MSDFALSKFPGKKRLFQGNMREIRNFCKITISEEFFVSSTFVSEGRKGRTWAMVARRGDRINPSLL